MWLAHHGLAIPPGERLPQTGAFQSHSSHCSCAIDRAANWG